MLTMPLVIEGLTSSITASSIAILYLHIVFNLYRFRLQIYDISFKLATFSPFFFFPQSPRPRQFSSQPIKKHKPCPQGKNAIARPLGHRLCERYQNSENRGSCDFQLHPPMQGALGVAVFFGSFSSDVRRNERRSAIY